MGCVVVVVVQIENQTQIFLYFNTVFLILFHNAFQKHLEIFGQYSNIQSYM